MEVDNDKSQMLKVAKCNFFQGENTEISILIVLKMMMIGGYGVGNWVFNLSATHGYTQSAKQSLQCQTNPCVDLHST